MADTIQGSTVIVIDGDIAIFKAVTRIGKEIGFSALAFSSCRDFSLWLKEHVSDALLENRPMCLVADAEMLRAGADGSLGKYWEFMPKIVIGMLDSREFPALLENAEFVGRPFTMVQMTEMIKAALSRYHANVARLIDNKRLLEVFSRLTERESEVCALVAKGYSNLEISAELHITLKTVKAHRGKVMKKTESGSIAEFVLNHMKYRMVMQDQKDLAPDLSEVV